jgi:hypothetical protein
MWKTCDLLHSLPVFQIHGSTGRYSKSSTLRTIPASLVVVVFWRLLCSHGTVCTSLFMPQYNYSYTNALICSIIQNLAHTDVFCILSFRKLSSFNPFKIWHDKLKEIYSKSLPVCHDMFSFREKPHEKNTKYLHEHCPVTPTSITSIRECDKQEQIFVCWIKNVTWQTCVT